MFGSFETKKLLERKNTIDNELRERVERYAVVTRGIERSLRVRELVVQKWTRRCGDTETEMDWTRADGIVRDGYDDEENNNANNNAPTITMTEYLFEKGADIETTDVRGRRALHYAVASENVRAVEFLLNEAKVAVWKDLYGRTALDECVNSNGSSSNSGNAVTNPELMEMLRKGMEKSKQLQEELF